MITRVDSVLVANKCVAPASADAMNVGEIAIFDENRKPLASADAAKASQVFIGVCTGKVAVTLPDGTTEDKSIIKYSNAIQKASHPRYVIGEYTAPVEDKIEIDFTNADIVVGDRYVVRIVYKDLYEAPGQFTHTYEVIADSVDAEELASAIQKRINKHPNRRVITSLDGAKLTLTAMPKDDNDGVYSLNEYSVVNMEATAYTTSSTAIPMNSPELIPGVVITRTQGNPGVGYWKQVRDQEVRALGYAGKVFTDAYPLIEPARLVEKDVEYDYLTIENDNLYLSADNQYIKNTPLVTEVYVKKGELASSDLVSALKAFVA
jgi:hypothetical protein